MIKEKELMAWADRTADAYHNLATDTNYPDCNKAFYTQSDLRKLTTTPDLLILTINPNGNAGYTGKDGYEGQVDNQTWKDLGLNGRMTGEILIKGNPLYSTREQWRLWKRLRHIFRCGGIEQVLDDESRYAYTELVLFNTKKAEYIPKQAYSLIPHTIELIDILQPKQILCVGSGTCLPVIKGYLTDMHIVDRAVQTCKLNDIPMVAVYGRCSYKSMEIAGEIIGEKMIF